MLLISQQHPPQGWPCQGYGSHHQQQRKQGEVGVERLGCGQLGKCHTNAGKLGFNGEFYGFVLFYWWGMISFFSSTSSVIRKFMSCFMGVRRKIMSKYGNFQRLLDRRCVGENGEHPGYSHLLCCQNHGTLGALTHTKKSNPTGQMPKILNGMVVETLDAILLGRYRRYQCWESH